MGVNRDPSPVWSVFRVLPYCTIIDAATAKDYRKTPEKSRNFIGRENQQVRRRK